MDIAALLSGREPIEGSEDDVSLEIAVKGHAKMMAHHERDEHGPGWLCVLRDVTRYADGYRWNSSSLNSALHERDRLMSYWSSRAQQYGLGTISDDGIGNLFRQGPLQPLRIHVVANEREQVRRQPTDQVVGR